MATAMIMIITSTIRMGKAIFIIITMAMITIIVMATITATTIPITTIKEKDEGGRMKDDLARMFPRFRSARSDSDRTSVKKGRGLDEHAKRGVILPRSSFILVDPGERHWKP